MKERRAKGLIPCLLLSYHPELFLQCHPARELVVHAATIFGNLQSFMKKALDEAVATQTLWPTLSSRVRVSG